jgi:uncharacterized membrane protein YcjF (UPF0283 family)
VPRNHHRVWRYLYVGFALSLALLLTLAAVTSTISIVQSPFNTRDGLKYASFVWPALYLFLAARITREVRGWRRPHQLRQAPPKK